MDRITETIEKHLADLGIALNWIDASPQTIREPQLLRLSRRSSRELYTAAFVPKLNLTELAVMGGTEATRRLLLMGPYITPRSADRLRERGVNYVDEVGNMHIEFDDVYVDVRGKTVDGFQEYGSETSRALRLDSSISGTADLFTPKRRQVIFALLAWPEIAPLPLRLIAEIAGVSIGQAQLTISQLHDERFLTEPTSRNGDRRLMNGQRLLELWTSAHQTGPNPRDVMWKFSGTFDKSHFPSTEPVFLSGEAAVPNLMSGISTMFYTTHLSREAIFSQRWRTTAQEPDIVVRKQFWKDPRAVTAELGMQDPALASIGVYDWPPIRRVDKAPDVLIYADLLASADGRQREIAEQYRYESDRLRRL